MPLIKYFNHKISAQHQIVINQANTILAEYEAQGYSLSLRQLYYQFVARKLLPNTPREYNRLGDIIAKGRESGQIDWKHIEDRGRTANSRNHFKDPQHFIRSIVNWYTIDYWVQQKLRIEIWLEKDALTDVVARAADPWDVTYFANKGYCSVSAIWDAGHNRIRHYLEAGLDVLILHLGDHDPSGIDMTRDITERLSTFSQARRWKGSLTIERIALNMDQVEEYDPPPNPAKVTDPRADNYIAIHGDESWELDALEPAVIVDLINSRIRPHVNMRLFNARKALEKKERQELLSIAEHYEDIISEYGGLDSGDEDEDDGEAEDEDEAEDQD